MNRAFQSVSGPTGDSYAGIEIVGQPCTLHAAGSPIEGLFTTAQVNNITPVLSFKMEGFEV